LSLESLFKEIDTTEQDKGPCGNGYSPRPGQRDCRAATSQHQTTYGFDRSDYHAGKNRGERTDPEEIGSVETDEVATICPNA